MREPTRATPMPTIGLPLLSLLSLAGACSWLVDADAYDRGPYPTADGGARDAQSAWGGTVLLLGGYLDGINGGEPTREVLTARFAADGRIAAWRPELQIPIAGRLAAAPAAGEVVAYGGGDTLARAQLREDNVIAPWRTSAAAESDTDNGTCLIVGRWALVASGREVRALDLERASAAPVGTTSMAAPRRRPSLAFARATLHVVGGAAPDQSARADMEYATFDPATGQLGAMQPGPALPASGFGAAALVHEGVLYVVGGNGSGDIVPRNLPHDRVHASPLDPAGRPGPFRSEPPLLTPLADAAAFVRDRRLYVVGGNRSEGNDKSSAVMSAELRPDGTLAPWQARGDAPLPRGRSHATAVLLP